MVRPNMRLLMLSSEFKPGPGGIGTHAYELAWNLVQLGWEVQVITPQDYVSDDEIKSFNSNQPFKIVQLLRPSSWAFAKALYRWQMVDRHIHEWQPDILMATGLASVWLTAAMTVWHRLPWVAIGHGKEFGIPEVWSQWLTRWAYQRATGVVCVSHYTRQRMLKMGIRPNCEMVIYNGANANLFYELPPETITDWLEQHQLTGKRLLLSVGSVTERKGYDIVIRSMPTLLMQGYDVHYLIAGIPLRPEDPAWEAGLKELAFDLGMAERVHFLGRVSDAELVKWYNACDIVVLTSRHSSDGDFEGYGIVIVEAALCGRPAVVSSNGGLAEAVLHGETGLCVPENDPEATGKAILSLLSDPSYFTALKSTAQKRAYAEQSWASRTSEYVKFIQGLL